MANRRQARAVKAWAVYGDGTLPTYLTTTRRSARSYANDWHPPFRVVRVLITPIAQRKSK